jgi:hypothetical protein
MASLYDELTEKLARDPRVTRRSGARADLGLLMFNARDSMRELWIAAQETVAADRDVPDASRERLSRAVEALRPVFGDRDRS